MVPVSAMTDGPPRAFGRMPAENNRDKVISPGLSV